ncbi:MAG: DUF1996 domain-containing protein [Chloroflexi bacterium]|nr:DUF1996 domain-containing protein [Chloroflexota bacterium]
MVFSRLAIWLLPLALVGALLPSHAEAAQRQPTVPVDELPQRGVFVEHCRFDHRAPDDPIVHPGMAGMSHSHDFFGNRTTNSSSTLESLLSGGTSCRATHDTAAYWVPTLSQNGQPVTPVSMTIYYRAPIGQTAATVKPFPAGFKMVAGAATATSPQASELTVWDCRALNNRSSLPPTCPTGSNLQLHVNFPECWDGQSLDSADHKSHMASRQGQRGCPTDHPVLLPRLSMIVNYPIVGDPGTITLASGSVYSGHGDFFNAWDQSVLEQRVHTCLNAGLRCGLRGQPR